MLPKYIDHLRNKWVYTALNAQYVLHEKFSCPMIPAGAEVTPFTQRLEGSTTASALAQLRQQVGMAKAKWCHNCCFVPRVQVKCVDTENSVIKSLEVYPLKDHPLTTKPILPRTAASWIHDAHYLLFSIVRGRNPNTYIVVEIHTRKARIASNPDELDENNLLNIGGCS